MFCTDHTAAAVQTVSIFLFALEVKDDYMYLHLSPIKDLLSSTLPRLYIFNTLLMRRLLRTPKWPVFLFGLFVFSCIAFKMTDAVLLAVVSAGLCCPRGV